MFIRIRPDSVHSLSVARSHPDTVTVLLPSQFTDGNLQVTRSDARILVDMLATALNLVIVDADQPRFCRNCGRVISYADMTWSADDGEPCPSDIDGEHAPRDLEV